MCKPKEMEREDNKERLEKKGEIKMLRKWTLRGLQIVRKEGGLIREGHNYYGLIVWNQYKAITATCRSSHRLHCWNKEEYLVQFREWCSNLYRQIWLTDLPSLTNKHRVRMSHKRASRITHRLYPLYLEVNKHPLQCIKWQQLPKQLKSELIPYFQVILHSQYWIHGGSQFPRHLKMSVMGM